MRIEIVNDRFFLAHQNKRSLRLRDPGEAFASMRIIRSRQRNTPAESSRDSAIFLVIPRNIALSSRRPTLRCECESECANKGGTERRTSLTRRAAGRAAQAQVLAANVDTVALVCGLDRSAGIRALERLVTLVFDGGALPLVVLNKVDLCPDVEEALFDAQRAAPGVEVVAVSAVTGEGLDTLRLRLPPLSTAVLIGPSGVGKSTLTNALAGLKVLAAQPELTRGPSLGPGLVLPIQFFMARNLLAWLWLRRVKGRLAELTGALEQRLSGVRDRLDRAGDDRSSRLRQCRTELFSAVGEVVHVGPFIISGGWCGCIGSAPAVGRRPSSGSSASSTCCGSRRWLPGPSGSTPAGWSERTTSGSWTGTSWSRPPRIPSWSFGSGWQRGGVLTSDSRRWSRRG